MKVLSGCVTLLLVCARPASAQTVLVPSGDSAVTQPGGTAGRAARHNIREAYRNGDGVGHRRAPVTPAPRPDQPRRTNPRF